MSVQWMVAWKQPGGLWQQSYYDVTAFVEIETELEAVGYRFKDEDENGLHYTHSTGAEALIVKKGGRNRG